MFGGNQLAELVGIRLQQLLELVHHLRASGRLGIAPGGKCRLSRCNRGFDGCRVGQCDALFGNADCRIIDVLQTSAPGCVAAIDEMSEDRCGWHDRVSCRETMEVVAQLRASLLNLR